MAIKLMMLNSLSLAESSDDILTVFVSCIESDIVNANKMHWIIIKRDEIDDIVLYDSVGLFVMSLKNKLVRRIDPTNTHNNNINGENETNMFAKTDPTGSDVFIFASFNTTNINVPTATLMAE